MTSRARSHAGSAESYSGWVLLAGIGLSVDHVSRSEGSVWAHSRVASLGSRIRMRRVHWHTLPCSTAGRLGFGATPAMRRQRAARTPHRAGTGNHAAISRLDAPLLYSARCSLCPSTHSHPRRSQVRVRSESWIALIQLIIGRLPSRSAPASLGRRAGAWHRRWISSNRSRSRSLILRAEDGGIL